MKRNTLFFLVKCFDCGILLLDAMWYHLPVLFFQVKALYVKNIPENTSLEELKQLFERHGDVTKVVMPPSKTGGKRNFGFIHYVERSGALNAVKDTEKYEINGSLPRKVLHWIYFSYVERRFQTYNPWNTDQVVTNYHITIYSANGSFTVNSLFTFCGVTTVILLLNSRITTHVSRTHQRLTCTFLCFMHKIFLYFPGEIFI